jgi:hypothetical protein
MSKLVDKQRKLVDKKEDICCSRKLCSFLTLQKLFRKMNTSV